MTFSEFSIRDSKPMVEAFARDGEEGSYALLVLALRYADSGEPVFKSVDEVFSQPFKLRDRLAYLSGRCAFANGLRSVDPARDEPGARPGQVPEEPTGPPH